VGCLTVDNTPIPMDSTPMDSLDLSHVTVRSISNRRFSIPIKVETVENTEEITALIDSGAEGLFIDKSIAHKWRTSILKSLIKVRNVDGTYNENGAITERCLIPFRINDKIMTEWFYVTALGDQNLILGLKPSPVAKTAAAQSITAPAHLMQVTPGFPPVQVEARRKISPLVHKNAKGDIPAPRETVLQQSQFSQSQECSNKPSQHAPEPVDRVQEPEPPDEVAINDATVDVVSDCICDVLQGVPPSAVKTISTEPISTV
jgi:hypothetical protein